MKKINTRVLTYAGVLIAMSIVLTRVLSIQIGPTLRITVGSVPTILAGLWFGPLIGGICGGISDLAGSLISGYAPNPFIWISAVLTGVIPALCKRFMVKELKTTGTKKEIFGSGLIKIMVIVGIMQLVTSQGFTTYGLSLLQGVSFWALFLTRLPQSIFLMITNSILILLLYTSPVTAYIQNSLYKKVQIQKRV